MFHYSGANTREQRPNETTAYSLLSPVVSIFNLVCSGSSSLVQKGGNALITLRIMECNTEPTGLGRKGRFVRQTKPEESTALGIPKGTEAWVLADNAVALEKVKQALRDKGPIDAFD
jgi:hypothetical protein